MARRGVTCHSIADNVQTGLETVAAASLAADEAADDCRTLEMHERNNETGNWMWTGVGLVNVGDVGWLAARHVADRRRQRKDQRWTKECVFVRPTSTSLVTSTQTEELEIRPCSKIFLSGLQPAGVHTPRRKEDAQAVCRGIHVRGQRDITGLTCDRWLQGNLRKHARDARVGW